MKRPVVATLVSLCGLFALQGCNSLPRNHPDSVNSAIPDANPFIEHYIAWIPQDVAQTATVAEAMAHISLVNARQQTARQMCNGQWLMNSESVKRVGPLPARAPAAAGGYPAWYYRISHLSEIQGCKQSTREDLYLSMQENLPAWMSIKTATESTVSRLDK